MEGMPKSRLLERIKSLYRKVKSLFLVAGTLTALKMAPAAPAKYIVQEGEEQKKKEIREKQERIERHKSIYPNQGKCYHNMSLGKIKQFSQHSSLQ